MQQQARRESRAEEYLLAEGEKMPKARVRTTGAIERYVLILSWSVDCPWKARGPQKWRVPSCTGTGSKMKAWGRGDRGRAGVSRSEQRQSERQHTKTDEVGEGVQVAQRKGDRERGEVEGRDVSRSRVTRKAPTGWRANHRSTEELMPRSNR